MSEKCRLCLQEAFGLASVFQYSSGELVADLIKSIIPITIERGDKLSQLICRTCLGILNTAKNLRNISIQNDISERKRTEEVDVKEEPFEVKQEIFIDEEFVELNHAIVRECSERPEKKHASIKAKRSSRKQPKLGAKVQYKFCNRCNSSHLDQSLSQGKFKCDCCELKGESRGFMVKARIEEHMRGFHIANEENFYCHPCDTFYRTPDSFSKHKRLFHPKLLTTVLKCKLCDKGFKKQKTFEQHMRRHEKPLNGSKNRSTVCDVCLVDFKTRPEMRLHKYIHCDFVEECVDLADSTFSCALCPFESFFEPEVLDHLQSHRSEFTPQAILVCLKCSWTFQDFSMLEKHTELHNKKITHRCLRCLKKFSYGPKFLRHIERHLSYTCDLCGSNESSKGRLEDHIKVAHMKVVCHLCPICGESKKTSGSLQSHIKARHETERKYQCSLCAKSFLTPTYLRNHQSVHSNEFNFPCTKCPKKFRTYRNLKRHQVYHDPSKLNYKHVCDQDGCGRSFLNKFGLDRHMLTHTGLRPWVCTFEGCDRAFSQSNDLNKHLRFHYGDCIYNCDFLGCSKAFKLKGELREHQTDHYKK